MWPRKRLDIRLTDVMYGICRCLFPPDREFVRNKVEASWASPGDVLACLSVRSGFDLLLGTLDLPAGSEVLVSAVTIPHMIDIIRHHGLVPVPVDLDADTLAPQTDAMRQAITARTRAVLVAHLFGGRFDMASISGVSRDNGLLVIEDSAQAFDGAYRSPCEADVTLYSFGPIKTCTALGGAIVRIRDPRLLQRISLGQAALPHQSRFDDFVRLLRYAGLIGLSTRVGFGALVGASRAFGWDYDRFLTTTVRSFAGEGFYERIRRQPSAALLALLQRRLRRFDVARFKDRAAKGELLRSLLQEHVFCPGWAAPRRTHWAFPVLVDRPSGLVADLREAGFDASRSHSLCIVDPPDDRPELEPTIARAIFARLVFLPVYPEMPIKELHRMAEVVIHSARGQFSRPGPPVPATASIAPESELHRDAPVATT
jgi:dTDP-4-amino-4,6-dideoxygalactose transaminase